MFIIRNGEKFVLTPQELRVAYEEQIGKFKEEDAKRHFLNYVFGSSEGAEDFVDKCLDAFELEAQNDFEKRYGDFVALMDNGIVSDIIAVYDKNFDCNVAENDAYENAINEVLAEVRKVA